MDATDNPLCASAGAHRTRLPLLLAAAALAALIGVAAAHEPATASTPPVAEGSSVPAVRAVPTPTPNPQAALAAVTMLLDDSARYIFQDGFESDSTTAWSQHNP